ncbi:MAG: MBL fold metallo-hydrolase [Verrucomicrobiales bacterium]
MRLTCFGVGDGWPSADRNHSSYLYQMGSTRLIVDCGEPVSRSFKASGLEYDSIDAVLLSHTHGDHVGGFLMFMQSLWLEQRKRDLPFLMPEDAIFPLQQLLEACYIFPELIAFRPIYTALESREPIEIGETRITPFKTTHLEGLRSSFAKSYSQKFESFAFLLQSKDFNIAHSADLGAVTDLEPLLQEPVDLLVCELAHFAPEEIFSYLQDKPCHRVAFVHVGQTYWEHLDETKAMAKKMLPTMDILFPKDGDELAIYR